MEPTETTEQTPPADEPQLTLAEHASQFGPKAHGAEAEMVAAEAAEVAGEKATPEPRKHRAASQQAGPKDVPRINALTGRAKAAEDRVAALEKEVADLKKSHAPAAQIAKAEARVEQAQPAQTGDPEPNEHDPKYAGNYPKYLTDQARWAARDEYRTQQQGDKEAAVKQKRQADDAELLKTFSTKIEAAKGKYKDFEAIAFGPTVIPSGSVVDAWIMEHKAGADVLYYLNSPGHRQELDSLLSKPVLEQVEDLTLLSQRLLSPSSTSAGSTTSATGPRMVVLPPKPPNVVRTEAQRAPDAAHDSDRELSLAEHEKEYGQRRRHN